MLLYAIVFAIGLAGMLHAPWWAAVAGSCALALCMISEDRSDSAAVGDAATWQTAQTLSSVTISTIATLVAFASGRFTAAIWGL